MVQQHKDTFGNRSIKVPFFYPSISKEDKKAVKKSLSLPLLTDGPQLLEFELKFSKFTGAKYAIGVSNATSALHLSMKALGIGKGDEVIIPDMTFIATANSVLMADATPVLADVEKDDMNISIESIKKSITKKTKAIIPVHFAGRACNIIDIMKIAKRYNLIVIEDCAHAIGAFYQNKHVGTFGNAGCFSFYPTKNITTIEGGMVITSSKSVWRYIKAARNHGINRTLTQRYSQGRPWDYDVFDIGYNYRLDEIRSSLGISQIQRVVKLNKQRKSAFKYYNLRLSGIDGIIIPKPPLKDHACHLYIIRILENFGMNRNQLFLQLLKKRIRTSVHYKPLHKFTIFKNKAKVYDKLQNSTQLYKEILSLPIYPMITRKEQDFVIDTIKFLNNTNRNSGKRNLRI